MINSGNSYDKYINAIIGGVIMSMASSLHLFLKGKITGISGTFFRAITLGDFAYNISFLSGMILMPSLLRAFTEESFYNRVFEEPLEYVTSLSIIGFIISGFLVGFGTKMANGCTSGHGVCGLPRLSKRSITAVLTFLAFGFLMATLRYYATFLETDFILNEPEKVILSNDAIKIICIVIFALCILTFIINVIYKIANQKTNEIKDISISFCVGILFSFGLVESGMIKRHLVLLFLSIGKDWDATLICVLGSAVGINLITFNLMLKKMDKPILHEKFQLPDKTEVDKKLVIGAAIFGIGWGFCGICPGPGVLCFYMYLPQTIVFILMLACGQLVEYSLDDKIENLLNGKKKEKESNNDNNNENNNIVEERIYTVRETERENWIYEIDI